jgi:recombination protein RecT
MMGTKGMQGTSALKAAATGQAQADQDLTGKEKLKRLQDQIRGMENEMLSLLGKERAPVFTSAILAAIMENPDLIDADRGSLFQSAREAAQDGLLPDGNEAVFNVYRTNVGDKAAPMWIAKVQYLPMVGGLIKRLYLSGEITKISAHAVYEHDDFDYELGDEERLSHRPMWRGARGQVVAAYAVVKLKNGETIREVMPREDVEKVRAASKAPNGPGWSKWYDQFAIKSVIKRIYKRLPKAPAFERLADRDNAAMGFEFDEKAKVDTPALSHQTMTTVDDIIGNQRKDRQDHVTVTVGASKIAEPASSTHDAFDDERPGPGDASDKAPIAAAHPEPEPIAECIAAARGAKTDDDFNVAWSWYGQIQADRRNQADKAMTDAAGRLGIEWPVKE